MGLSHVRVGTVYYGDLFISRRKHNGSLSRSYRHQSIPSWENQQRHQLYQAGGLWPQCILMLEVDIIPVLREHHTSSYLHSLPHSQITSSGKR